MSENVINRSDAVNEESKNVLWRILLIVRPYWGILIVTVILNLVTSVLDNLITYINQLITDEAVIPDDIDKLWHYFIILTAVIVLLDIIVFFSVIFVGKCSLEMEKALRASAFRHLHTLQLSYFSRTPVGWILSRITSDTTRITDVLTWGTFDGTFAMIHVVVILGFMFAVNWKLALVALVMIPFQVLVSWEIRKRILRDQRETRKQNSIMTASLNENLTGIRVVKALRLETSNLRDFEKITEAKFHASFSATRWNAILNPLIQFLLFLTLSFVLWGSKTQFEIGGLTIGGIKSFISYFTALQWPIQELTRVFGEAQQAIASGERYLSLMDTEAMIVNRPGAKAIDSLKKEIEFKNVSFRYDDGDQSMVLKNVDLSAKPGEVIALVGSTGGGKTTLVNLLARFYEPTAGVITIGGRDYRDFELSSYQSKLGIVLQTPHLFSGTVYDNIRYGKLDANETEVEAAAIQAGADEFIRAFPNGYKEEVGEGGNLLSVGQKQLISIARAILADPDLFILDEATSSVDTLTEKTITASLEKLMAGRTSFIIAHRLSTVKRADRIAVIENGEIVETGSHRELLKKRGRYFELYSQQFRLERESSMMQSIERS